MILIRFFTALFVTCLCFAAQAENRSVINAIIIEGNQRIEKETIESYLTVHKGDVSDQQAADSSLKKLFATGLFSNVNIERKASNFIVKVTENPMINKISFEGNAKIKKDDFLSEMLLKPRMVYSTIKLQQDVNRIIEMYNHSGRYAAKVEPKIIKLEQNRINLVFEINEGPKTTIDHIYFAGNKNLSDNKLRSVIKTKESHWYNFFSSNDNYDPDRLEYDKEFLRRFYNSLGYADFKVISATAELSPERKAFIITFSIEEGEKYQFGDISLENKLENINHEELRKNIITTKGDTYNLDEVEDSVDALTKYLTDKSFAFVNIDPEYTRDTKDRIINVKYMVEEGRKYYVGRINITGNVRTKDKVIRREFRFSEGDPFNATLLERSEKRIKDLDFFDKAEITKSLSDDPDKIDLNVEIQEKSTARLNLGGGVTTEDKKLTPIGQISFAEDNLMGTGRQAGISLQVAPGRTDWELSFTEPYFMDKELQAGIDLFRSSADRRRSVPYHSTTAGGVLRMGYAITEHLQHGVRYTLKEDKISDIAAHASKYIKAQSGKHVISSVGHTLVYDRTNSRIRPTKGYLFKFDQEFAGLGGQSRFLREEINGRYYIPLKGDDLVLSFAGDAGHILGMGKDVNITERYFMGDIGPMGLRGFATGGIGPREKLVGAKYLRGDPIGGNIYYKSTTAVTFPLGLPDEFDISGAWFLDAGSLFGVDLSQHALSSLGGRSGIFEDHSLRASTGFGIVWVTKFGPIRLDFAYPFLKKKYDRTQYFHIDFATHF